MQSHAAMHIGHFGVSTARTAKITPPAAHPRRVVARWQQPSSCAFCVWCTARRHPPGSNNCDAIPISTPPRDISRGSMRSVRCASSACARTPQRSRFAGGDGAARRGPRRPEAARARRAWAPTQRSDARARPRCAWRGGRLRRATSSSRAACSKRPRLRSPAIASTARSCAWCASGARCCSGGSRRPARSWRSTSAARPRSSGCTWSSCARTSPRDACARSRPKRRWRAHVRRRGPPPWPRCPRSSSVRRPRRGPRWRASSVTGRRSLPRSRPSSRWRTTTRS